PLRVSPPLVRTAYAHSRDMAAGRFLSHTGSDGADAPTRLARTGYAWRLWGENVAAGYDSPAAVMAGWMGSAGHRDNILNPAFAEIGVDVECSDICYWTMVLAAPQ
ncbi:MAG TPA: CAP domain-containing protein, partial [Herpetosiphonaceae bacterium]